MKFLKQGVVQLMNGGNIQNATSVGKPQTKTAEVILVFTSAVCRETVVRPHSWAPGKLSQRCKPSLTHAPDTLTPINRLPPTIGQESARVLLKR